MTTTNTAPMLGADANGGGGGPDGYARSDYRQLLGRTARGYARGNPFGDADRRLVKLAERRALAAEIAEQLFGDGDVFVPAVSTGTVGEDLCELGDRADDLDLFVAEAGFDMDAAEAIAEQALMGDGGYADLLAEVEAAEMDALVNAELLELYEDGDLPTWGTAFDPADVQWGFAVRTRP